MRLFVVLATAALGIALPIVYRDSGLWIAIVLGLAVLFMWWGAPQIVDWLVWWFREKPRR